MLALGLSYFPGKGALQAKRAPRAVGRDILRPKLEEEQIGHDCDGDRALDPIDACSDLMLAQAHHPLQFFKQDLDGMISNDKFCCTRWGALQLSWWRRPNRLRR
jgi:hypothetical protein